MANGFLYVALGWFLGVVITAIAAEFGDRYVRAHEWQRQAIDAGHAEYYLDENYDKQFRWLPTHPSPAHTPSPEGHDAKGGQDGLD